MRYRKFIHNTIPDFCGLFSNSKSPTKKKKKQETKKEISDPECAFNNSCFLPTFRVIAFVPSFSKSHLGRKTKKRQRGNRRIRSLHRRRSKTTRNAKADFVDPRQKEDPWTVARECADVLVVCAQRQHALGSLHIYFSRPECAS